jgi:hypothetical protein
VVLVLGQALCGQPDDLVEQGLVPIVGREQGEELPDDWRDRSRPDAIQDRVADQVIDVLVAQHVRPCRHRPGQLPRHRSRRRRLHQPRRQPLGGPQGREPLGDDVAVEEVTLDELA